MKTIERFCASQASTSICLSMDQYAMVRHKMKQIDGQTHRLGDRLKTPTHHTCLSDLPLDPRPFSFNQRSRKSPAKQHENRRKSSANNIRHSSPTNNSSRYLLSEKSSKSSSVLRCSPAHETRSFNGTQVHKLTSTTLARSTHESPVYNLSSSKSNSIQVHTRNQVVELRVSIHCKGCEGKVRKHLSKMEGVKSFSIDLVSKKVTVIGNVTPLSVLASISKVKNAQFWPSPTPSSSMSRRASIIYGDINGS